MFRFIRKLTVIEWIVMAALIGVVGTFASDHVRAQMARHRGVMDAQRDAADDCFQFRIGGKRRLWFDQTAAIFRQQYQVGLVASYGCCPTCSDWSYDQAYNQEMARAATKRLRGQSFHEAYAAADDAAKQQWEMTLAP